MRFRSTLIALVAVIALGLAPAAGTAQSGGAGGDQYQDPFGSSGQQKSGGSSGSSGSTTTSPPPTQTAAPTTTASSAPTTTAAPTAPAAQELPRTGADTGFVAAIGAALLLAGAVLRRRLRHERL